MASYKSKSCNVLKLNFERDKLQAEMTEMCTRHPIHIIIDRQIAYMCETDHIARSLFLISDDFN